MMKQVSATIICKSFHLIFFVAGIVLGARAADGRISSQSNGVAGGLALMGARANLGEMVRWYSEGKLTRGDATRTL